MDVENILCEIVEFSHPSCDRMYWWILARTANILLFINDGIPLHQMTKYHIITEKAIRVSTSYFEGTGASWLNILVNMVVTFISSYC
jgi:hypothetical protein